MAKRVVTESKESQPRQRLMGENYRIILIDKVDSYMGRAGLTSDTGLSVKIFGSDNQFVTRLRDGRNFTLDKALRLETWLQKAEAMLAGEIEPGDLPALVKRPKQPRKPRAKKAEAVVEAEKPKAKRAKKAAEPVVVVNLKQPKPRRKRQAVVA